MMELYRSLSKILQDSVTVIENQTLNHKKSLMFKYGRMLTTPVSVWLPWRMPKQHVAWASWLGFFSAFKLFKC